MKSHEYVERLKPACYTEKKLKFDLAMFGGKNIEEKVSVPFTTCCSRCLHGRLFGIPGAYQFR